MQGFIEKAAVQLAALGSGRAALSWLRGAVSTGCLSQLLGDPALPALPAPR